MSLALCCIAVGSVYLALVAIADVCTAVAIVGGAVGFAFAAAAVNDCLYNQNDPYFEVFCLFSCRLSGTSFG